MEMLLKRISICQENCQRAKILSSKAQIMERRKLVFSKKTDQYCKDKVKYNAKSMEYELSVVCEQRLCTMIDKMVPDFRSLKMLIG